VQLKTYNLLIFSSSVHLILNEICVDFWLVGRIKGVIMQFQNIQSKKPVPFHSIQGYTCGL